MAYFPSYENSPFDRFMSRDVYEQVRRQATSNGGEAQEGGSDSSNMIMFLAVAAVALFALR
jgi:hypothetical protein